MAATHNNLSDSSGIWSLRRLPTMDEAQRGLFSARKLLGVDDELKSRHFRPAERNTVCQNLLIYFRRWRRREIVKQLAERLAPGGLLVLGQGELTDWQPPGLQRVPSENILAWMRRQTDED